MRPWTCLRQRPMKVARSPIRAGSNASMRSRTRRATTGEAPPVPTATTTSPRSTMAGKMNVECGRSSITLTGRPTALARTDIAIPMSPAPAHRIAITPPRSAASGSPSASSIRAASAASKPLEIMIAIGREPANARAGRRQQAQFRPRQLAGPDEQHGTGLQIEKHRQKSHAILSSPTSGVDWNYFLYMSHSALAKRKLFLLYCIATIEFSTSKAKGQRCIFSTTIKR